MRRKLEWDLQRVEEQSEKLQVLKEIYNMKREAIKYPRCTECKRSVPMVDEKVIKGKRHQLCSSCARKAGWYDEDQEEQGKLF
jgi:uncharacterized protein with PIN domain